MATEARVGAVKKPAKPKKWYPLDAKKHGVGGLSAHPIGQRIKEDRRAKPAEFYAVVFFPQYQAVRKTIGPASINFWEIEGTLANSPEAARIKFMDRIAKGEKWSTYAKAGHRVRKVRIVDCGNE